MNSKRILIIDDDEIVRISVKDLLEDKKYSVNTASDGKTGMEKLKSEDFDIVLLDLKLPDMNGIEILRQIRTVKPDVLTIMITGYATLDTAKEAIKLGAVNYLTKPINPQTVIAAIRNALDEKWRLEYKPFQEKLAILLVDDDPIVRESIKDVLVENQYDVSVAANGTDALKQLKNKPFPLLIVDLRLPDMSGIELIEQARTLRDTSFHSVIITAYSTIENIVDAMKKGIYEFIPKPVNPKTLLNMLAKCTENMRDERLGTIKLGSVYLVREKRPVQSFKIFNEFLSTNVNGLCITRFHPDEAKKEYALGNAQTYWLTLSGGKYSISPTNIEILYKIINDFTVQHNNSVVLLDGLEFLIVYNDFSRTIKFVHHIRDTIVLNKSRMLIPIDVETLNNHEAELLMRELDILETPDDLKKSEATPVFTDAKGKGQTAIDEIFLMYNNGILIKHFTRRLKPDIDADILSSMFVAIQHFVKDTFRAEEGKLNKMQYGDYTVVFCYGKWLIIAAIIEGNDIAPVEAQFKKALDEMERKHENILTDWNGALADVVPLHQHIKDLIAGKYADD